MKKRHSRSGRFAALAVSTAVLLAACGSSAAKQATGGSGGGASTNKSYTVMVIADTSGSFGFTTPEVIPAVKGAFGHDPEVKVVTCDSMGTASAALNCEHQAVVDHAAAVIVGQSNVGQDQAILTQAGIPALGDTDFTSPTSFSLSNGYSPPIGLGLYNTGCRRLGIIYLDGTDSLVQGIIEGGKWQTVAKAAIPANAPDLTPAVAKLGEAKVQCIALSVIPTEVAQAMTAVKQGGLNVQVAGVSSIITKQVISSLGSVANGMLVIGAETNGGDSTAPVITQIATDMKAFGSNAAVTQLAVLDWAGAKLVLAAAQHIQGPVTAGAMLTALNGLRNVSTDGAIHPFSAIPLKSKAYPRAFNHYVIDYVVKSGVPTRLSNFIDLTSVLETL
jgi:hypothetical protein